MPAIRAGSWVVGVPHGPCRGHQLRAGAAGSRIWWAQLDLEGAFRAALGRRGQCGNTRKARAQVESLSNRALQMLVGVVLGLSNKDIADVYGRSARTVKCDRTMLTRRLDVCASLDLGRLAKDAMVAIEELEASRGGSRNRLSSRGSAVWHGLWSNAS